MFRLVLIHQLVLSLLVGPMLCCCTTARLGHGTSPTSRTTAPAGQYQRKQCCGDRQKSSDDDRHTPDGKKPGGPAKCPCKDSPAKVLAVPEVAAGSADSLGLLNSGTATLALPATLDGPAARPAARFDFRSSSLSTADLLFAHHNLRC